MEISIWNSLIPFPETGHTVSKTVDIHELFQYNVFSLSIYQYFSLVHLLTQYFTKYSIESSSNIAEIQRSTRRLNSKLAEVQQQETTKHEIAGSRSVKRRCFPTISGTILAVSGRKLSPEPFSARKRER